MEPAIYRLVAYLRVEPEDSEPLTHVQALAEKEQQEFLFPENIYQIKEVPCIPSASKRS